MNKGQGFQIQADAPTSGKGSGKGIDRALLKRLLHYVQPYKGLLIAATFLTIFGAGLSPLRPYLTKIAVDDYIAKNDLEGLVHISLLLGLVVLLDSAKIYGATYLTQLLGQRAVMALRMDIFKHLQKLSLRFFDRNPIGRLMTRATNDVESLNEMLSSGLVALIGDVFQLTFIIVLMIMLDWQLTLVTMSVLPIMVYITFLFKKKVRVVYQDVRTQVARLNSFLQEHITGMATIQLFGREPQEFEKHTEISAAHRDANIRSIHYYSIFYPTIEFLSSVAMGLIIWHSGARMLDGTLTVGIVISFVQFVTQFFRPLQDLSEKYNIMQTAISSAERIFSLLDEKEIIDEPKNPIALKEVKGHIRFENVSFAYNDENWVLRDIDFEVKPGEKVAIVGATGSGKTTIISLLSRFYDIQKGTISIDGNDIKQIHERVLRQHLGVVMQDVFLFSGTIRENITLGNPDITDEDIQKAAKLVGAAAFIQKLPGGYDYQVMERGGALSTGQRQLISFVRAMVYNPKILILDEATSSVDTETEYLIESAMQTLMKGRTSIVIAHRLSTVQRADKIIVLHKGVIREVGSHQELLQKRGLYYKLYLLQYPELLHKQAGFDEESLNTDVLS
ncbi:ABC transporter-related protein [Chloroherpeton thalassium ATCC 35110]|uniref:ABC transporter-related protein n=1 Tax=Chloroherpeton thalassium (strain ATCC 35110 / GB-78) TaxID=517418 RepID=B3QS51_CHLT3|nr:ABC transporter ATP-binding protein [Chloroherpeton thalassium]ACF13996.1 ABC transporter-related protein [Chloroherpeton thalassium ATCC 35110]